MAGEGTKRIIDLTEAAETQSGDYIAIDSTGRGTRKLPAGFLATAEDLSEEQTARQTADATLDGKITSETQARIAADNEIGEQITALDEKTEADAALIQNPTKTLSGALCSFTDGADMPMVACTAEIVPKQSGSGTPSPSNVRQISGWESVDVNVRGKNLIKYPWHDSSAILNGVTFTDNGDGTVTCNGTATANTWFNFALQHSDIIKAGSYKLSAGVTMPSGTRVSAQLWINNAGKYTVSAEGANEATFTPAEDGPLRCYVAVLSGTTVSNLTIRPMLRPASITDPTFAPYNGHTTTTPLGRTVHGGTLDVVSGVLTVDRVMVDLGTLNWQYNGSSPYKWFYTSSLASTIKPVATNLDKANMLSPIYEVTTRAAVGADESKDYAIWLDRDKYIGVRDSRYTSAAAFKTAMSGVQLVYELATPQTYTLTPTEIQTLLGENNVWADSGDVEITYRRDISIVINNLESALNG